MFLWGLRAMLAGDAPAAAGHEPAGADGPFDPGAAIARHLARKAEEQQSAPLSAEPASPPQRHAPGGFGRRRVPQAPV
ncbi:MAG: hypothetical protein JSS36_06060 [Proteobacteria bacterium]|nr:hypothetical protein [Pseudomonadota bacterium]